MDKKEQAIQLRKEGMTYREISNTIPSISIDWCKRNLKGVTKGTRQNDPVLISIVEKACEQGGMTRRELISSLLSHYTQEDVEKINLSYYKQKMRKIDKKAVIRPEWMDKEHPKESNRLMMDLAHCLFERMEELADNYIEVYPNANRKSLLYEFRKMLSPNVSKFCQYNEEIALMLSQ